MIYTKKVLLLTDWYHPGFKAGGPIQSCRNLVAALKDELEIFVFTSDRDLGEIIPYSNVQLNQWNEIAPKENVYYASPENLTASNLLKQIKSLKPDVIYLNSMFSLKFTLLPLWLKLQNKINAKIVLAPRGMLHQGALQYKPLKKKLFLTLLRLTGITSEIQFHATDDQEMKDIQIHFPSARNIFKAPNFASSIKPDRKMISKGNGNLSLVFVSRIAPKKNLQFIFDLLSKHSFHGSIHLTVAGEIEDQAYWQSCLDKATSFPENIKFSYGGPIEHSILLDWLQQFHFFILPTFGENFGHAIFEAFIAGKPVIISDKTPWRDLHHQQLGWDLPLENEQGFINAITEALNMDQEQYQQWSEACAVFADNYRNNNETRKRYLELFNS